MSLTDTAPTKPISLTLYLIGTLTDTVTTILANDGNTLTEANPIVRLVLFNPNTPSPLIDGIALFTTKIAITLLIISFIYSLFRSDDERERRTQLINWAFAMFGTIWLGYGLWNIGLYLFTI